MRRDIVIVACAVSAGIHAALVPEHLRESTAAGGGFIASTVLLAVMAVALTYRPEGLAAVVATALVVGGLLAAYALAVTTGVPVLHPEQESVDALALFTKAIELLGLAAAVDLIRTSRPVQLPFPLTRTEGARA